MPQPKDPPKERTCVQDCYVPKEDHRSQPSLNSRILCLKAKTLQPEDQDRQKKLETRESVPT